jgi:hypothetical protein
MAAVSVSGLMSFFGLAVVETSDEQPEETDPRNTRKKKEW